MFSMLIAWSMPPFMGADEMNHIHRADLLTYGQLIGERIPSDRGERAGGTLDRSLDDALQYFETIPFHPEAKVDAGKSAQASAIKWQARLEKGGFENTAVYPPFFYLPQTLGLWIGKALDQPVVRSVYFARTANALTCVIVGFCALLLACRARLLLFTMLMLPMSVALYGTVTQDGMAIATSALGCALLSRAMSRNRATTRWELWGATLCFALVGMVKQPYVFFCLLPLVAKVEQARWRWVAAGSALAATLGWYVWMGVSVQTQLIRPDAIVDPYSQIQFLLNQPLSIPSIAAQTIKVMWKSYLSQFIGVLGWLDTILPKFYYYFAQVIILISLLLTGYSGPLDVGKNVTVPVALILLGAIGAIFAALYVVWTPVGFAYVEGVQGRYFLPVAVMSSLMLEGMTAYRSCTGFRRWAMNAGAWLICAFPMISLLITERAILGRYYLP